MKTHVLAAAVLAAALAPGLASAQYILDTGTPGGGSAVLLNTSNWYAAEFTVTAGETISELSAYVTQGSGQIGDTFTWDLYSANGAFLGANNATREAVSFSATDTFSTNGWNSTAVSWTPATPGNYWLALEVGSTSQTRGLDLPTETSTGTGTAPAIAFAYAGSNHSFQLESNNPIGVQVSAVPWPSSVWLLAVGLFGLGSALRGSRAKVRG